MEPTQSLEVPEPTARHWERSEQPLATNEAAASAELKNGTDGWKSASDGQAPTFNLRPDPMTTFAVGTSLILIGLLYWRVFVWWYSMYMRDESYYSHGPLVPIISLGILYLERDRLRKIRLAPSLWGLVALVPALALVVLSNW